VAVVGGVQAHPVVEQGALDARLVGAYGLLVERGDRRRRGAAPVEAAALEPGGHGGEGHNVVGEIVVGHHLPVRLGPAATAVHLELLVARGVARQHRQILFLVAVTAAGGQVQAVADGTGRLGVGGQCSGVLGDVVDAAHGED